MTIIKTEEIQENGVTYIVNTYDNGTVEKYIKPDPNYQVPPMPEQPKPVTNEDIVAQLEAVQVELEKAKKEQEATKALMLDSMQGTADLYLVEQENKQLQLDTMQGIADLYAMQMGGGQ